MKLVLIFMINASSGGNDIAADDVALLHVRGGDSTEQPGAETGPTYNSNVLIQKYENWEFPNSLKVRFASLTASKKDQADQVYEGYEGQGRKDAKQVFEKPGVLLQMKYKSGRGRWERLARLEDTEADQAKQCKPGQIKFAFKEGTLKVHGLQGSSEYNLKLEVPKHHVCPDGERDLDAAKTFCEEQLKRGTGTEDVAIFGWPHLRGDAGDTEPKTLPNAMSVDATNTNQQLRVGFNIQGIASDYSDRDGVSQCGYTLTIDDKAIQIMSDNHRHGRAAGVQDCKISGPAIVNGLIDAVMKEASFDGTQFKIDLNKAMMETCVLTCCNKMEEWMKVNWMADGKVIKKTTEFDELFWKTEKFSLWSADLKQLWRQFTLKTDKDLNTILGTNSMRAKIKEAAKKGGLEELFALQKKKWTDFDEIKRLKENTGNVHCFETEKDVRERDAINAQIKKVNEDLGLLDANDW